MNKLVSVIIPCYNYAHFLGDALDSVIAQTYSNWECLVIDDGSTDLTSKVAGEFAHKDKRIKYIYKVNGGLSSARNEGITNSKGEFLCFLDADDLFDPKKIEEQVKAFIETPSADIVYGKAAFFESGQKSVLFDTKSKKKKETIRMSGSGSNIVLALVKENFAVVSAPLIKRRVFDVAGTFDTSYFSYEDWHFWTRAALNNMNFQFCDQPAVCTYIRFGHESMMSNNLRLLNAGIQLRTFLQTQLKGYSRLYNFFRLQKSKIKLWLTK